MADNLFIRLVAKLNQSLSKANVQSDVTKLENTPFFIKLIGKLNKGATRAAIQRDISEISNTQSIRVNRELTVLDSGHHSTEQLKSYSQRHRIILSVFPLKLTMKDYRIHRQIYAMFSTSRNRLQIKEQAYKVCFNHISAGTECLNRLVKA